MKWTPPYEAREDSYLLAKHIKEYAKGKNVLDIGTGSGVFAIEASKYAKKVIAADINPKAIALTKKNAEKEGIRNIKFIVSNLFSRIKKDKTGKDNFDLITFNPPYLPTAPNIEDRDIALDGGKKGYELLGKFLDNANNYLSENGKILVIFSELTKPEKVKEIIANNCFYYKEIDGVHVPFEELYVWEIGKSELLKKLEKIGIRNITFFARGKRGYLYKGKFRNKTIVIKASNPYSKAVGRIENEIKFLKILEKYNIAPKIIMEDKDIFGYEYIKGEFILNFIENNKKKEIISVLKKIFEQMYLLDKLSINKEEMHHPVKHILVNTAKKVNKVTKKSNKKVEVKQNIDVKLVDFERANMTSKPKNVTQFCQFLIWKKMNDMLRKKGIVIEQNEIIKLAQKYKKSVNDIQFRKILDLIN